MKLGAASISQEGRAGPQARTCPVHLEPEPQPVLMPSGCPQLRLSPALR